MRFLRKIDHLISPYFVNSDIGWASAEDSLNESGTKRINQQTKKTMGALEWQNYRDAEKVVGFSALESWLNLLGNKESRLFHVFQFIKEIFRKQNYKSVLELGSGQCIVASLLKTSGFKITASDIGDLDLLINNIADIDIDFTTLNFEKLSAENLSQADCVLAIQVDFLFDSKTILQFLRVAKSAGSDVLFVNTQIIGPFQALKYKLERARRMKSQNAKMHGWVRSLGEYTRLAGHVGYNISISKSSYLDTHYFIHFHNSDK